MLHSESPLVSEDSEGEVSIVSELSSFESPESDSHSDKLPLVSDTESLFDTNLELSDFQLSLSEVSSLVLTDQSPPGFFRAAEQFVKLASW